MEYQNKLQNIMIIISVIGFLVSTLSSFAYIYSSYKTQTHVKELIVKVGECSDQVTNSLASNVDKITSEMLSLQDAINDFSIGSIFSDDSEDEKKVK